MSFLFRKLLENNQLELDENKIGVGFLYTVISNNGFVIEQKSIDKSLGKFDKNLIYFI